MPSQPQWEVQAFYPEAELPAGWEPIGVVVETHQVGGRGDTYNQTMVYCRRQVAPKEAQDAPVPG